MTRVEVGKTRSGAGPEPRLIVMSQRDHPDYRPDDWRLASHHTKSSEHLNSGSRWVLAIWISVHGTHIGSTIPEM